MQAQRKIDPAVLRGFASPAPADGDGWAPRPAEDGGATAQSSPAHLLLLELSARLHPAPPAGATIAMPATGKWPMPARLMTIAALSIACWAGVILTALSII